MTLGHGFLFSYMMFWAKDVSDMFYLVIVKWMWTFYPRELFYVHWIKSHYVILYFHVFYYINMYIGVEGVTHNQGYQNWEPTQTRESFVDSTRRLVRVYFIKKNYGFLCLLVQLMGLWQLQGVYYYILFSKSTNMNRI